MRRLFLAFLLTLAASSLSAATFTVINTNDSGAGSLRQAILDANANPGADTIAFNIPGAGVHTIAPATALDPITDPVIIDGYTQPGSSVNTDPIATNAVLMIELDGTDRLMGLFGLTLEGPGGSTIRGLVINRWGRGLNSSPTTTANTIVGNFIGTDPTGTQDRGNSNGITDVGGLVGDVIGGTSPADRNLVSGSADGIEVQNPGVVILGNLIGTDATGTVAIDSGGDIGIFCEKPGLVVGGPAAGAGNVISGTGGFGLFLQGTCSNAVVQGNKIGTTADGTGPIGSQEFGIQALSADNTTIGGIGAGEPNIIAFNSGFGIGIFNAVQNTVRGNSIHDNGGLGIDLAGNGPTANDSLDADTGANNLQNFPIIQTVTILGPQAGTHIQGKLNSTPSTTFDLDFYANAACPNFPRELLEGETYLGSSQVTTDGSGHATIDVTLAATIEPGQRISATAIDPDGNTSEFSQQIAFSSTPASGPAAGGTAFTVSGTDFADPTDVTVGGTPAIGVTLTDDHTLNATMPAFPPGTSQDVVVTTPDGTTGTIIKGWVADFLDTPSGQQFYSFVTTLVSNGITAGVGGGNYGPDQPTLRQQMAVFILKAKHGLCYTPPPCTGTFADVPCPSTFADWIEAMAAEGITGGCGGGNFCPTNPVRRDQMAVFLLKGGHGSGYAPPPCVGVFADVPCPSLFADWIEQLLAEGVTGGCGGFNYCPSNSATRGQMAVFLVKTFGLQ